MDNLEITAPRKEFLTVMDQVHQFFDHYENRTHGVPLDITVGRRCIVLHLRLYLRPPARQSTVLLLTEKVPRGNHDWACVKETLFRALGVDECQVEATHMLNTVRWRADKGYYDSNHRKQWILKASGVDEDAQWRAVCRMMRTPSWLVRDEFQWSYVTKWPTVNPPQVAEIITIFDVLLES